MMNERYAVLPIRGLWMAHDDVSMQLLDRDWALVNPYASNAIDALIPGGMRGSVDMLRERMKPDALLIVRRYMDLENALWDGWRKAVDTAEQVLSALNLLFLTTPIVHLTSSASDGLSIRSLPVPVWLTRVPEHPDLPIIFGRDGFQSSGHSQWGWPSFMAMMPNVVTMSAIDAAVAAAPSSVRELLVGQASDVFKNATRALMSSFNATSQGQFIAQALSSLEILFGENDRIKWDAMKGHVKRLCGADVPQRLISSVFQQRHDFIHRHQEPTDPSAHFAALAVVASAFIGWAELSAMYEHSATALDILEVCGRLVRAAARNGNPNVLDALDILQMSPQSRPQWVKDWLAEQGRPTA